MERLKIKMELEDYKEGETSEDWHHRKSERKEKLYRELEEENVYLRGRVRDFERKYCIPGNNGRNSHWGENYDEDVAKQAKKMKRMEHTIEALEDDLESQKERRRAAERDLDKERMAIPEKVEAAMARERRQYELSINEKDALLRMANAKIRELEEGNSGNGPIREAMVRNFVEVQVVRISNQTLEKKIEEMANQMAAKEQDWEGERGELKAKLAIYEAEAAAREAVEAINLMPTQQEPATGRRQHGPSGASQQIIGGTAPQSGSPLQARRRQRASIPGPSGAVQQVLGGPVPQSPPTRRRQAAADPGPSDATEPGLRRTKRTRTSPKKLTL